MGETRRETIGCSVTAHDLVLLPRAIESVRYYVDKVHVLIDDRAHVRVEQYCTLCKVPFDYHRWRDSFADMFNIGAKYLGDVDWVFQLDSDEMLRASAAASLRVEAARAAALGADLVLFRRAHWNDLAMTDRNTVAPWPDWQERLYRPHVYKRGRAHPRCEGFGLAAEGNIQIEHFNTALRTPEQFKALDLYYRKLTEMDLADSRVY